MSKTIKFIATLPDVTTAITMSGDEAEGARVKLNVPMSDLLAMTELKVYGAGHVLHVTVEVGAHRLESPRKKPAADEDDDEAGEFDAILS